MALADENKVLRMAKEIWKSHFAGIMPFEMYYMQIKPEVELYLNLKSVDKKLYLNYKRGLVKMTLHQLDRLRE